MYAYWTSQYGSDNEHSDTPDDVDILENSCLQETGFKMFWDLPSSKPARHEAHFITSGGAGDIRHKFGTETVFGDNHDSTQAVVLYGAVKLHKDSVLTVRVRAGSNATGGGHGHRRQTSSAPNSKPRSSQASNSRATTVSKKKLPTRPPRASPPSRAPLSKAKPSPRARLASVIPTAWPRPHSPTSGYAI